MAKREFLILLKAAREGDVAAELAIGKIYLEGSVGLPRDEAAAFIWLEKAAHRGSTEALRIIGERVSPATVHDPVRSAPLFLQAAELGIDRARTALIDWTFAGIEVGISAARAFEWLELAARNNDKGSQLRLALLLYTGEACEPDVCRALRWFERAAALGSVAAQELLADHYRSSDENASLPWLRQSASRGDAISSARLGILLLKEGKVLEAMPWLERAASADNPQVLLTLGKLYATKGGRQRVGVPHSYKKAAAMLDRASEQGVNEASFELWKLYNLRTFSQRDAWTAHRYLERAAEQGHVEAQYRCGKAYLRHGSARDDDVTAVRWLIKAAAADHREAASLLESLYPKPALGTNAEAHARTALINTLMRAEVTMATRIELKVILDLRLDEALLIDLSSADRGVCLLLPSHEGIVKSRRRIVLIDSAAMRELVDRAKRILKPEANASFDARDTFQKRKHAFLELCKRLGLDPLIVHDRACIGDPRPANSDADCSRQDALQ